MGWLTRVLVKERELPKLRRPKRRKRIKRQTMIAIIKQSIRNLWNANNSVRRRLYLLDSAMTSINQRMAQERTETRQGNDKLMVIAQDMLDVYKSHKECMNDLTDRQKGSEDDYNSLQQDSTRLHGRVMNLASRASVQQDAHALLLLHQSETEGKLDSYNALLRELITLLGYKVKATPRNKVKKEKLVYVGKKE